MNVRLLKEHRINGVLRPVGYECDLPEQLANWLDEQAILEIVGRPAVPVLATAAPVPAKAVATNPPVPPRRVRGCCGNGW